MSIRKQKIENFLHARRYAFPIKCTEVILSDDKETVVEVWAEFDPSKKTKPKVFLYAEFSVILKLLTHSKFQIFIVVMCCSISLFYAGSSSLGCRTFSWD